MKLDEIKDVMLQIRGIVRFPKLADKLSMFENVIWKQITSKDPADLFASDDL